MLLLLLPMKVVLSRLLLKLALQASITRSKPDYPSVTGKTIFSVGDSKKYRI